MNNAALALSTYGDVATPARSERDVEYQAFARVTSNLEAVNGRETENFAKTVDALYLNRRLWTILATDIAHDNNALEDKMKVQLVSLSIFVIKYSSTALREKSSVKPLIEINKTIMRGLRSAGGK